MRGRFAIRYAAGDVRRLAREESGVALLMTLAFFLMLFILCCGVYATGEMIHQRTQLQNMADAAAHAAAVVQADALSSMAVINRAMSWTYIQLCREQMDYIVFSWLDLTCKRFREDYREKVRPGGLRDFRHYCFDEWKIPMVAGFNDRKGLHKNAYYVGVGDTQEQRRQSRVSLNGRTAFEDSVAVEDIEGLLKDIGGPTWKEDMEDAMDDSKKAIGAMNEQLTLINFKLEDSIQKAVEYVLYQNLPKEEHGKVVTRDAEDFYWVHVGGTGGMPLVYTGEAELGSYFEGLRNTEEDEIQFLQMANGLPAAQDGGPGWMGSRGVVLSDYFGLPGNETATAGGLTCYLAGGLDQWYIRGTEDEAASGELEVEKRTFDSPPGGIQRVYKHTNRDEAKTLFKYHRPNHIFQGNPAGVSPNKLMQTLKDFMSPSAMLRKMFNGAADKSYNKLYKWYRRFTWRRSRARRRARNRVNEMKAQFNLFSGLLAPLDGLMGGLGSAIGQVLGGTGLGDLMNAIRNGDIPPSDEHALARFPDQCRHVAQSTGLVSQYEWASAYWICPWVFYYWPPIGYVDYTHIAVPLSEIIGCDRHGYGTGTWFSWLPDQLKVLLSAFGATRADYKSCFINLDPTSDPNNNTQLRGYARIYGDDAKIFNPVGYVGEKAMPWILGKSFFEGDGTILVGVARRQRNPFWRLVGGLDKPNSLYEPFSPKPGGERFLVALATARAAWAPRPDVPRTGLESMNGTGTPRPPGNYEPRFDAVTDHKFEIEDNEFASGRMGCVCGKADTEKRLLRMWNLSQTDWDGTLLPLRHAYDGHSPYDSGTNLKDGSTWDYEGLAENGVVRLTSTLLGEDVKWENGSMLIETQLGKNAYTPTGEVDTKPLSSYAIFNLPLSQPAEDDRTFWNYVYWMFLHRRLL